MTKKLPLQRIILWLFIPCLVMLVLAIFVDRIVQATNQGVGGEFDIENPRLLESNSERVVLELTLPDYQIENKIYDNQECQLIGVDGFGETGKPGWPRLPVKGSLLGIPLDGDPVVEVLEAETSVINGRFNLCPAPSLNIEITPQGETESWEEVVKRDSQAYAIDQFMPSNLVEVETDGFIRSQRVLKLNMYPFQYNPASGALQYTQRLVVQVSYPTKSADFISAKSFNGEGTYESFFRQALVNYTQAREWREVQSHPSSQVALQPPVSQRFFKIIVDKDGIYRLKYSDLQAAGLTVQEIGQINPQTLQLSNIGQEVAIYFSGEEDGIFDDTDYLLFYGQKLDTKFSDENVYWLSWGVSNGLRMDEVSGAPSGEHEVPVQFKTTVRMEEDKLYIINHSSGTDIDHWYWEYVSASSGVVTKTYETQLMNVADVDVTMTATVRGLIKGYTATPEHHTKIYLNDNIIEDAFWLPQDEFQFEVNDVDHSYVWKDMKTIITVEVPLDNGISQDKFFVNWFEIDYFQTYTAEDDRLFFNHDQTGIWEFRVDGFNNNDIEEVFDITDPFAPKRIIDPLVEISCESCDNFLLRFIHEFTGEAHYFASTDTNYLPLKALYEDEPSNLRATSNSADYIIITHPDFRTEVQSLADWRAEGGLQVIVVDVTDVYDEFSHGIFNPEAIRGFLDYAYHNWTPTDHNGTLSPPEYVLLVGDGTYDFKDNLQRGEPNYIPPYLGEVDPWVGETASENLYVSINGDDLLPDLNIGRLPVKTVDETRAVVDKILSYEQNPPQDNWNQNITFIADDYDPSAGDFAGYSDQIADNFVPPLYNRRKIYYCTGGECPLTEYTNPNEAKDAIIESINQGSLIVNYIGHASIIWWANGSNDNLFHRDDVSRLSNLNRYPFIVPMTCQEGYFIRSSTSSTDNSALAETFLLAPGKGAIASWSPTGYGVASGHDYLNKGLYQAIFFDDVREIGPATTLAKLFLYENTVDHRELIHTYALFGDPALRLHMGQRQWLYFPLIMRP